MRLAKNLREIANTNLLITKEIKQAKPCHVSQGLKESLDIEIYLPSCHGPNIYALTYAWRHHIVALADINLVPDKTAVFREVARIPKPGGRLSSSYILSKRNFLQRWLRSAYSRRAANQQKSSQRLIDLHSERIGKTE